MAELSLSGMRTVYDEVMRDGLKRQRSAQQILGDLLAAEVAEKARSIRARGRQVAAGQDPDRVRLYRQPGQRGPGARPS
jgi:hypothetical protein